MAAIVFAPRFSHSPRLKPSTNLTQGKFRRDCCLFPKLRCAEICMQKNSKNKRNRFRQGDYRVEKNEGERGRRPQDEYRPKGFYNAHTGLLEAAEKKTILRARNGNLWLKVAKKYVKITNEKAQYFFSPRTASARPLISNRSLEAKFLIQRKTMLNGPLCPSLYLEVKFHISRKKGFWMALIFNLYFNVKFLTLGKNSC